MQTLHWQFGFLESQNIRNYFCKAQCKLPPYILLENKSFVEIKGINS